ncbi:MAG: HAMP domain-containing histidine kinase [Bacteroidales bacterium]|nr:HAMP domain-containing histidine kinase [Bacteroidales bacterium]
MNLLTKTTLYFITVSLFVFFLGGIVVYQLIKVLENSKVNSELIGQMHKFSFDLAQSNLSLYNTVIISGGLVELHPAVSVREPIVQFEDTLIYDNIQKRYIPYRELSFYTVDNEKEVYHVHFYKSLIESDFLIEKVAMIVTLMVVIFLLAVYFLYRYFFRQIWADFFITIEKIEQFDISSPEIIDFPESMIVEFNRLNDVLKKMTERILNDFNGLKEFTANLSHEIQTPLAVIKSKNELILQNENAPKNLLKLSVDIQAQISRLSRLIKAISLLAKIDNRQFTNEEEVNLRLIIKHILDGFQDILELKLIHVNTIYQSEPDLLMNKELAELMLLNLIKNAVNHNILNGKIDIELSKDKLLIQNTGKLIDANPEKYFARFVKANPESESLGIGLSLVKKICDLYGFDIRYAYRNNLHIIEINFP